MKAKEKGFTQHHFLQNGKLKQDGLNQRSSVFGNPYFQKSGAGFTIIELLVSISIIVILSTLIVVNLAGLRINQKLKIAENELVTNLRKIQNYSLSSRVVGNNQAVQYYLLKIDLSNPHQYTIQAMHDVGTAPKLDANVETVYLPAGVRFSRVGPVTITRPVFPFTQTPDPLSGCALVVYKLPFAKTLFSNGCNANNWDANSDDYEKILNFVANVSSAPENTVSADSKMDIRLSNEANTISKTVTIQGVSGLISFN
jgi:prepilin-type N-terminal cleavage/methylation domain-containing protein